MPQIELKYLGHPALSLDTVVTELSWPYHK